MPAVGTFVPLAFHFASQTVFQTPRTGLKSNFAANPSILFGVTFILDLQPKAQFGGEPHSPTALGCLPAVQLTGGSPKHGLEPLGQALQTLQFQLLSYSALLFLAPSDSASRQADRDEDKQIEKRHTVLQEASSRAVPHLI